MAFISDGRILINLAFTQRYSLPSFNVCSLEMARACVMAADEERAPIMLQTGPDDLQQGSPGVMAAMIRALAEEASVPIMLHLDHGDGLKMATRCLRAGYSSVMFDGEALPEDDNIRLTQRVWRDWPGKVDMHYPVYREAREAVFEIAREKIRIMGASGQA